MQKCIHCGTPLAEDDMPPSRWSNGDFRCRPCFNRHQRRYHNNRRDDPEYKEALDRSSKKYRTTTKGRAAHLLLSAQSRCRNKGLPAPTITREWIEERIEEGSCPMTGEPFNLHLHPVYHKNPWSPSLDRQDLNEGYTPENVVVTNTWYNFAKCDWGHNHLLLVCRSMLEGYPYVIEQLPADRARREAGNKISRLKTSIRKKSEKKAGMAFELTPSWLTEKLIEGRCELTGMQLTFSTGPSRFSVDRIDSSLGYTPENCRVTTYAANILCNEWDDMDVRAFATALLERN